MSVPATDSVASKTNAPAVTSQAAAECSPSLPTPISLCLFLISRPSCPSNCFNFHPNFCPYSCSSCLNYLYYNNKWYNPFNLLYSCSSHPSFHYYNNFICYYPVNL